MASAVAQCFGVPADRAGVTFAGRTDRSIVLDLFALHDIPSTEQNIATFVRRFVELLPEHLQAKQGRVLPGVSTWLQRLGARDDLYLGLITGNLHRTAHLKLEHYGISSYFHNGAGLRGGFGDDHVERDDVARMAMVQLRGLRANIVASEQVWVVGDTTRDIQCARAIGARVIAVATGGHDRSTLAAARPDVLVDDLTQATECLDEWLQ